MAQPAFFFFNVRISILFNAIRGKISSFDEKWKRRIAE
jgi:hypothetical protein